ncbi:hypothetical protein BJV82DRAFT_528343 [Fennellomyces sp. T-0311]|nr:hypothetical protein BJV82DRAFT_528343 [Fennellomyces sp. T-0311]
MLYSREVKAKHLDFDLSRLPCIWFGLFPILTDDWKVVFCKAHENPKLADLERFVIRFPDPMIEGSNDLNYRERACLSPVKMLCAIDHSFSRNQSRLGHYILTGNVNEDYNYEFAGLTFNGTLGLQYSTEARRVIRVDRVRAIWSRLREVNPLCRQYAEEQEYTNELVHYFVERSGGDNRMQSMGWSHNAVVSLENVPPAAGDFANRFEKLHIGTDGRRQIRYRDDDLFGLLFPHLYHWAKKE